MKDVSGRVCQEVGSDQFGSVRIGMLCVDSASIMAGGNGGRDLQRLDYDHLRADAAQAKAAHPLMLRAIAAAKK